MISVIVMNLSIFFFRWTQATNLATGAKAAVKNLSLVGITDKATFCDLLKTLDFIFSKVSQIFIGFLPTFFQGWPKVYLWRGKNPFLPLHLFPARFLDL